jgi:nitrous oxidase accessory protein NosD
MHFQMSPDAKLVVKPNSADGYSVLYAEGLQDVEISGGQIVGDRDQHMGTTGEGGHGVRIRGSQRVTIRDMLISKGWGDGISVGPKTVWQKNYIYSRDIVVANVICTSNRRNGLSIGNVIGMKVYDSEFNDTNGTTPQCGIDVEPDKDRDGTGYCDNVWIENCVMRGNAKYGVNVWKRSRNLTITKCMIEKNLVCGLVTRGLTGATFTGNTIRNTVTTGMFIQSETRDVAISGNTFYNNYTKQGIKPRADFSMTGVTKSVRKDLIVGDGTSNIRVGKNYYK